MLPVAFDFRLLALYLTSCIPLEIGVLLKIKPASLLVANWSSNGMYLAIDIGGSKTLVAIFSEVGEIVYKNKFKTDHNYNNFLKDLQKAVDEGAERHKIRYCCCGAPGQIDRQRGIAVTFGNLPWSKVPLARDVSKLLGGLSVSLENDAKLAALSEAQLVHKKYKKVLYITISTGIGDGTIIDGKIDPDFADSEAGHMVLDHGGKLKKWEDLASGRALVEKYGKKASEINDPAIWKEFAGNIARGLDPLVAIVQPDIVIVGGGVGAHFDKFGSFLDAELKKFANKMVQIPPIMQAKRPEEAVIYGCYEYAKQNS